MRRAIRRWLRWCLDDWRDLVPQEDAAALENKVVEINLNRCRMVAVLLMLYEPISLILMLTGHTQTYTGWYVIPTMALAAVSILMNVYLFVLRRRHVFSSRADNRASLAFIFSAVCCMLCFMIGDITQYGQEFLNYIVVLILTNLLFVQRFRRSFLLGLLPFLTEMIGFYVLLDHTLIIEPLILFIASLATGNLFSHTTVVSEENRLKLLRQEDRLRLSEERYRLALTQSGNVFFFYNVATRTITLSDELALAFGLPNEVSGMPDNMISQELVEPKSVAVYRDFYARINSGEAAGSAVISCHARQAPNKVLWYRISFSSVFDSEGAPVSAIITYEDLQSERDAFIKSAWSDLDLLSVPESQYAVLEFNLTLKQLRAQTGGLFAKLADDLRDYESTNAFLLERFTYQEDTESLRRFLALDRLYAMLAEGKNEDAMKYRSLQNGPSYRWMNASIQLIRDPYSDDVLARLLIRDINDDMLGIVRMQQNMDELQKKLEQSRIRIMMNQMQPHFLYNALSAIQTITKSDPDYASRLIYDFTVHLRGSIRALQSDAPIPFTSELKNIRAYLNIEQMRFGDSLKVCYDIECDDFAVIPLSIQPLAENAARHGIFPKGDEGGTITIRSYETEDSFVVMVQDDGVGFDVDQVLNSGETDSIGLKSLIYRLKSLMSAEVAIESVIGCGTKVTVTLPQEEA